MKAWASSTAALLCVSLVACGPAMQHAPPRALPADLQVGRLSDRTAFEQTDADGQPIDASDDLGDTDKAQRGRKAGFVAGVIATALGGGMAVGFGAAGQIAENQLDDAYREGVNRSDEAQLQDRGEAFNAVAITGAALTVVGLGVTAIILGIDHRECGELIKKRHRECRKRRAEE